jgi:hypothetical protein
LIDDYLKRIEGKLRSVRECKRQGKLWKKMLPAEPSVRSNRGTSSVIANAPPRSLPQPSTAAWHS